MPAVAQAGGLPPQPRTISDDKRETLTKLVSAVHDAALNPAALEHLASTILRNEHSPAAMRLAALLRSPTDPNARPSASSVSGSAPVMPDATQAVAQRKIQMPDAIATVFETSVVSFPGPLQAPEDLQLLAEHLVPFEHIEPLLSVAGATPHPELRAAPALFQNWTRQGLTVEQQVIAAGFMAQGFDQAWAEMTTQRHAQNLRPLHAWLARGHDVDLSFRLDNVMTEAVSSWLAKSGGDLPISAPVLACLPAMIQSDMNVRQIDRIWQARRSAAVIRELNEVFKPDAPADAAQQVRYGLITAKQLFDRIIRGQEKAQEIVEAEAEQLRNVPELNKNAAHTRDALRRLLHAMKNLHPGIAFRAPHSRLCTRFANAWQDTVAVLNELLRPQSDSRAMQPRELIDKLNTLHAHLSFQITELEEPQDVLGLQKLA